MPHFAQISRVERKLPCKCQDQIPSECRRPELVFIKDNSTPRAAYSILEEAFMRRQRPEPQGGSKARACLQYGQFSKSCNVRDSREALMRGPRPRHVSKSDNSTILGTYRIPEETSLRWPKLKPQRRPKPRAYL